LTHNDIIWSEFLKRTAVAGLIIGIHPFDQPDVRRSRSRRRLRRRSKNQPPLPPETDVVRIGYKDLSERLRGLMSSIHAGDYFAVLAHPMNQPQKTLCKNCRGTDASSRQRA
jgi:hypothetical protein